MAATAQEECKSITNDDERLACYDLAFGAKKIETPEPSDTGKWHVSVDTSALTDETNVYLSLESDDEIRGQFGSAGPATLILRCKENTTSAFFRLNNLFLASIQGYGKIEYRLDTEKMSQISAKESTDNKALGLWSGAQAIPFAKKLIGHETLIIRATPYNESPITATFDIRGVDQAILKLRETCRW
ncbi:type VI secretion system-associated protein TagO [Celeribacter ethanolicus]|uniref:type VI secretion system-associated protein TagO n=1 Tax=Celeribacter ethanolicus TaxID=1758178 RepID=UPI00138F5EB7|nr:type VI secretion system-associated protein TagO [Celeribacter ethanolicus]